MVDDAHRRPLQEVRLGGCQDKGHPPGPLTEGSLLGEGFALTTAAPPTSEGGTAARVLAGTCVKSHSETEVDRRAHEPHHGPQASSLAPWVPCRGATQISKEALTLGGGLCMV